MTKVDVFSGFLGAGKTTLIKKLIAEAYAGEKLVLIENEFGEIGVDGGFMKDAGIEVTEMNSGCICCSLTGDFRAALHAALGAAWLCFDARKPVAVGGLPHLRRYFCADDPLPRRPILYDHDECDRRRQFFCVDR